MKQKKVVDRRNYLFDNKALVKLIVQLIVEQLMTILVGIADSIMVASVGEATVSGVSLVDQVMVYFYSLEGKSSWKVRAKTILLKNPVYFLAQAILNLRLFCYC